LFSVDCVGHLVIGNPKTGCANCYASSSAVALSSRTPLEHEMTLYLELYLPGEAARPSDVNVRKWLHFYAACCLVSSVGKLLQKETGYFCRIADSRILPFAWQRLRLLLPSGIARNAADQMSAERRKNSVLRRLVEDVDVFSCGMVRFGVRK
jgi:hypothetical protein